MEDLTVNEAKVLILIKHGYGHKQIAHLLDMGLSTVGLVCIQIRIKFEIPEHIKLKSVLNYTDLETYLKRRLNRKSHA